MLLKVRYDNELKRYMKTTGLRAKDLRAMAKAQPKAKNRNRNRSAASQAASSVNSNPQLAAQAATFMGLPITAGVPMGMLGAAAGAMSMLPPHFTQVSTCFVMIIELLSGFKFFFEVVPI